MTAAHLPGAPQEEREDLLDVLAQERRLARVPPLSQPRPRPNTLTVTPTTNPNLDPIPARAGARLRRAHGA